MSDPTRSSRVFRNSNRSRPPWLAASNVARNRGELRCRTVGQIEPDLVDVAPAPTFRRIITLDDRVPGGAKMLRGMAVGRTVATADVPAGATEPQVNPGRSCFEAFLAAARARCHGANGVFVSTYAGHHALPDARILAGWLAFSARKV